MQAVAGAATLLENGIRFGGGSPAITFEGQLDGVWDVSRLEETTIAAGACLMDIVEMKVAACMAEWQESRQTTAHTNQGMYLYAA